MVNSDNVWTNNCLSQMIFYLTKTINLNCGILIPHSIISMILSIISFFFHKYLKEENYFHTNNETQTENTLKRILKMKNVPQRSVVSTNVCGGKNFMK
jgi:hypothetical protein